MVAAGNEPVRVAFLARGLNALAELAQSLTPGALGHAAGAPSHYEVLLTALAQPEALAIIRPDDPLAAARLRGLQARARLLATEGGTLTASQAAQLLGLTRQAIDKRRRAGRLLAVPATRRAYAYPAWQFGPGGVLPGLEAVLGAFTVHDPWAQAAFFVGENTYLDGETPLAVLRRGDLAAVRRAATAYGEHGAA